MKNTYRRIRREFFRKNLSNPVLFIKLFQPFLGLTLLSTLPAILYGCRPDADLCSAGCEPAMTKVSTGDGIPGTLDIFVFMNDRMQRLDSYQRVEDAVRWDGTIVSGSGDRIITLVANSGRRKEDWFRLNSRAYLYETVRRLEDERAGSFCMSAEIHLEAEDEGKGLTEEESHKGGPEEGRLSNGNYAELRPYVSEVVLNSISCDFTGRPYSGERLTDARVYLTNVNADCPLLSDSDSGPMRIINAGALCPEDLEDFTEPSLLCQEIPGDIGIQRVTPGIRLWCYQNCSRTESIGTPFTRMVIEGKISGQTFYWPVNINRDGGDEPGVWRNRRYVYDILITRKGSFSPDIPVSVRDIKITQKVLQWKEKEEYTVSF